MLPSPQKVRRQRFRLAVTAIMAVALGISMALVWVGSWFGR